LTEASRARLERAVWIVIGSAYLAMFVAMRRPEFMFRYEIDPTDGDVLNTVKRLALGWPLYGDWAQAQIGLFYTPLFCFYLRLAEVTGADAVVFGRVSNTLFVAGGWALVGVIAARSLPIAHKRLLFGVLALVFLDVNGEHYGWAVNLRSDPLAFVLECGVCYLIAFEDDRIWLLAAASVLAVLAKQSAVEVPLAMFLYFVFARRGRALRYAIATAVVAACLVIPLEWWNSGHFLQDTLILPPISLARKMEWSHLGWMLGRYFHSMTSFAIAGAAAIGVVCTVRHRLKVIPLVWLLIVDLILLLDVGRNLGGGVSYVWMLWALVSLFAAIGSSYVLQFVASRAGNRFNGVFIKPFAPAATAAVACVVLLAARPWDRVTDYRVRRDKYFWLAQTAEAHQKLIDEITSGAPAQKWLVERFSTAVVRAGNVLEQEACTFKDAFDAGLVDGDAFVDRLKRGEFRFAQRSGDAPVQQVEAVLDSHFRKIRSSAVVDRGRTRAVEIWEYAAAPKNE
jgi:hypothetical protein